ncbi:MAG: formate dehydrogenase subunit alpha [Bacillota bacterium]
MEELSFLIDDKRVSARNGMTVLEAALGNNIYIPHLCHHPDLSPAGVCRLCYVELEGKGPVLSCRTPVKEGMVIKTRTSEVDEIRRGLVELLIANHHDDCRNCRKKGRCELQRVMAYLRIDRRKLARLRFAQTSPEPDTSNPFFDLDPAKCVLCERCVRICGELLHINAIAIAGRGYRSKVTTSGGKPLVESSCESCGECVERCPVGGLVYKEYQRPENYIKTVCPYCSTGCGVKLGIRESKIVSAHGDLLCAKGRFGWRFIYSPDRLKSPLVKTEEGFTEISWDDAVRSVAARLSQYKGDQIAFVVSAKLTNEDAYLIQKFARTVLGTNNVDNTARLSHAASLEALWETTGIGGTTNPASDVEGAACILLAGANITKTHPVIAQKLKRAVKNGSKLIVIDPVENDLHRFAHLWLKPYPGTDLALLMGMARVIVEEGLVDEDFVQIRCENFESLKEALEGFPLGRVERLTGVPRETVVEAAQAYATAKPAAAFWSTGITQHCHGKDSVYALINLAMLTANIGRPSAGLYPLLEQNNTQGVCDMGCLPGFYPGFQTVTDKAARERFTTAWKTRLSGSTGLTLTELWDAVLAEKVKALYIIGGNPAVDMPNRQKMINCLEKVEFIVFQDLFLNETAAYADLILPAAGFAEKEGTFTCADRQVKRLRKAVEPVGRSLPDWEIIRKIAGAMGAAGFDFAHPGEIMKEIASLIPGYDTVSYGPNDNSISTWRSGVPVLHAEGFSRSTGKGKLVPVTYEGPVERPDVEFPLTLITKRNAIFYGACAHKVEGFRQLAAEEFIELNPKDAADSGVDDGEEVKVVSRRGQIIARVRITDLSPPSVVVLNCNCPQKPGNLLNDKEAKICPVRIEK